MTIDYVTKPNDRFDLISWRAYGTVNEVGRIIRNNPDVTISSFLPEGLLLKIPVLERIEANNLTNSTPPWK